MKNVMILVCALQLVNCLQAQSINDSLLLYLPFNGNANDASGNGNNGVVYNATLATDRHGTDSAAYDFNGSDSYIEIPASPSLSKIYLSNEVTIAAWINIRSWYNNWNVFAVFEQYDSNTDWGSVLLEANWSSGGILFESGYNTNYIGCDYSWNFNEWHHLAATYSRLTDTARFYVDGNLLCTKEYHEVFTPDSTNPYVIGRSLSGPDEYSNGIIDEVRIYNRALRDSELLELPTTITAIKNNTLVVTSMYPNPVSNMLHIKTDRQLKNAQLYLFDCTGREVLSFNNLNGTYVDLNLQFLSAGLYIVKIKDERQEFTRKLLKN